MVNFLSREISAIARIGNLSQECIDEDGFGQIVTSELLALLNSVSGVFIEFEQGTKGIGLLSGKSYIADDRYMDPYLTYYHKLDPVLSYYRANHRNPSAISTTSQVIQSERIYLESEFYRDFLAQTGIHQAMIFGLSTNARPFGLIGLHRERMLGAYSEKDRAIIQLVMPYLSLALQFRQEKRKRLQNATVMGKLLTGSRIRGYLVVDHAFALQSYAGDLAGLIRPGHEGAILRGIGTNIFGNINERLRLLLLHMRNARTDDPACPGGVSETPTRQNPHGSAHFPAGQRAGRRGDGLHVETVSHENGSTHYLCLSISGSNALLSTPRTQAWRLTVRQMEIVKLVALGMTNNAIAQAMGISPKTVENYLTAIYRKTGATNKISLISLLSN